MSRKRTGYLIRRGKVYYACWTVGGKKFMQTTGKRDEREAEAELNRIMVPFIAGDEVVTLQNIAATIKGRKVEIAKYEEEKNPPLSIRQAWDAYEKADRKQISPGTLRNYDSYWSAFTRWMEKNHPDIKTLRDVSYDICVEYKAHLIGLGLTGRTFNAHRSFLLAFWNVLCEKAKLTVVYTVKTVATKNPWAKVVKLDEESQGRRKLETHELRHVCQSATGELRTMLALGLYLGCRMGDACCMKWDNVDMTRRTICYVARKTARKRPDTLLIPIHPELYAVLNEIPPGKRKGPVTPDMLERYTEKGQGPVSAIVQRHFETCGLTTTGERNGAGIRRRVCVGFHSLRHSAVSLLRQAGAAQSISQAFAGHNSPDVHALYSHTDEEAMRRAVETLPSVMFNTPDAPLMLPPADPLTTMKANVRALAEKLNGKNWQTVKKEFLELAE